MSRVSVVFIIFGGKRLAVGRDSGVRPVPVCPC